MITSNSNPQIKNLVKLMKSKSCREEQGTFIVEGSKMFLEARELGLLKKIFITEEYYKELLVQEPHRWRDADYEIIGDSVMKSVSDTITPQGVIGLAKKAEYEPEELLCKGEGRYLFLENIRDPGNLGTLIRTAEGAGMTAVFLSKESTDIYNPKVVRATMGSIFRMPFVYCEDFLETLKIAKKKEIQLFAAYLEGSRPYFDVNYKGKYGILIGNEAKGLSKKVVLEAHERIRIPMEGKVESLNAAVAGALIMYEATRQKWKKGF